MPRPLVHITPNYSWRNKHENVERQVARLYTVWNLWEDGSTPDHRAFEAGMLGLQQVIGEAQAAGRRLRPLGGSWSLSEVAATNDFLVDTKALNILQVGLDDEWCVPAARPLRRQLVLTQCGATILDLNRELEARRLSLKTSGASNGQTFAGALSTGTHGGANQFGSMPEMVVALHVLREDGQTVWIERASRPIASPEFLAFLGGPTLIRDDLMFRAALVGIGTFGFIHAAVLEAEPIYLLERYIRRCDLDFVRPALDTLDVSRLGLPEGGALPFHFEVIVNPYATGAGKRGARMRFMYKRPYAALPVVHPEGDGSVTSPGDDLLAAIGVVGDLVPEALPAALGHVIESVAPPVEKALGTHGQTFGSSTLRGAGTSMELGVSLADANRALDVILAVASRFTFGAIVALRYVRSTDALLGFTRFPTTCTIELPATRSPRSTQAYDLVVEGLAAAGLTYTLHWGQALPLAYNRQRIQSVYRSDAEAWVTARHQLLTTPQSRWMFASDVLDRAGLST